MSDVTPERAMSVEEKMRQLQDRAEKLIHPAPPWWYSGSACLAALMWIAWLTATLAVFFGYVEQQASNILTLILLLVLACVFSAHATKR